MIEDFVLSLQPENVRRHKIKIRNGPAPVAVRPTALPDKQWFKLQNIGQNAADLWIYDEIGGWGITAQNLVSELSTMNVAQINVHLNSPGGDVFDGIAIMNSLRDHPANVTITVDALAASIASVIAQAGNKIIMGRNSTMMVHNASGFAMGEAKDLRKMADLLDSTTANIASIYSERAGGTPKSWLAVMDVETWYTAEEAVAAGLADEVAPLPTERDAHAMAARWDLSNFAHAPDLALLGDGSGQPQGLITAVPDPAPEPVAIAWDPAAFRAGLTAVAAEYEPPVIAWNPDLFRAAITTVTNDVPASEPPTPAPAPVAGFDPSIFTEAIRKARA
jgi:ATP-dependent protease ClpP protease subunit